MLTIEVWSDIVCPWCYIGKRRLEHALQEIEGASEEGVEIVWRSFELDPEASPPPGATLAQLLASKYGMSREQTQQMQERVTEVARQEGLEFHLEQARPANTFAAHRLLHLARSLGKGAEMKERLLRAYFTEGCPVGDEKTLLALAEELGISSEEAQRAFEDEAIGEQVRHDERRARELGIRGVPFFVINGAYGISGAQPVEIFQQVFHNILQERASSSAPDASGSVCEGGVCEGDLP